MISEVDRYHGVALRLIIAGSDKPVVIGKCDSHGRLNSYSLDERIAIYLKHSTKRLAPWAFSFTVDHLKELVELRTRFDSVWIILVCGLDGVVGITLAEFASITASRPGGVASLRVDRAPRTMYRVFGNESPLQFAKSNGVGALLSELSATPDHESAARE